MKHWSRKQKHLHKSLIIEHRREGVLWFLGIFLAVYHPEYAEKALVDKFQNNKITIKRAFSRVIVCDGIVNYFEQFPYKEDMNQFIKHLYWKYHIKIKPDMYFEDILKLERSLDLSPEQRRELINSLFNLK